MNEWFHHDLVLIKDCDEHFRTFSSGPKFFSGRKVGPRIISPNGFKSWSFTNLDKKKMIEAL